MNKKVIFCVRYGTSNNFSLYKEDYIKLYVDTIQDTVQKNDKLRIFTISSPSNGLHSIEEDYIAQNPQDPYYGDGKCIFYLPKNTFF